VEWPPADLGFAAIGQVRKNRVPRPAIVEKKSLLLGRVIKFVFCLSLTALVAFVLTSLCLGKFNWDQHNEQLSQLPFI